MNFALWKSPVSLLILLAPLVCLACEGTMETSPPNTSHVSKKTSGTTSRPTQTGVDTSKNADMDQRDGFSLSDQGQPPPDQGDSQPPACRTSKSIFEREVWPKVGAQVCVGCHIEGGTAELGGAKFILRSEAALTSQGLSVDEFYSQNLERFRAYRAPGPEGFPLFMSKAIGTNHGGGKLLEQGGQQWQILQQFEASFETEDRTDCVEEPPPKPLEDIKLLSATQTLRKASIMLAGRVPNEAALKQVQDAPEALADEIDKLMSGLAFHEWLKYSWNEIFHFRGLWQYDVGFKFQIVAEREFGTRDWGLLRRTGSIGCSTMYEGQLVWQRFNYPTLELCDGSFGRTYLQYRVAYSLMEEPLELIAYLIEEEEPFTEVLTTDSVMMNYYSSLAYYGSGQAKDNPYVMRYLDTLSIDDIKYPGASNVPVVQLPTMHHFKPMQRVRRSKYSYTNGIGSPLHYEFLTPEEYPRSGLLTSQIYLTRFATTDTNVNRHRAWAFMRQFLGVDILALADRRGDPVAAEMNSDQPTIDDANCNVCHNVMDPIAGLFQNFLDAGSWKPRSKWPPEDQPPMIGPGISIIGPNAGATFSEQDSEISPLQYLGRETIKDPRFASTMVRHAFAQVIGRPPLEAPLDGSVEGWRGLRAAFDVESSFLAELQKEFQDSGFNMKRVYRQLLLSPFFRATSVQSADVLKDPVRQAGVSAFGTGNELLTPTELHRKVEAFIGRPWQHTEYVKFGRYTHLVDPSNPKNDFFFRFNTDFDLRLVDNVYRDMYGGIDYFNNLTRIKVPSSVTAAAGRRIAYEVSCATVAQEFASPASSRVLFSDVSLEDTLETNRSGIQAIVRRLFWRSYGQEPTTAELDAVVSLLGRVQARGLEALKSGEVSPELPAHCQASTALPHQSNFTAVEQDPNYSVRAWMTVLSHIIMDPKFLYEW